MKSMLDEWEKTKKVSDFMDVSTWIISLHFVAGVFFTIVGVELFSTGFNLLVDKQKSRRKKDENFVGWIFIMISFCGFQLAFYFLHYVVLYI